MEQCHSEQRHAPDISEQDQQKATTPLLWQCKQSSRVELSKDECNQQLLQVAVKEETGPIY